MPKLIVLFLIFFIIPSQALGMERMSDAELESVSGQAGMTIAVDDVKMYADFQGLWLTDTDGLGSGDGASVGIRELSTMVHINAITSYDSTDTSTTGGLRSTGRALQGHYDAGIDVTNNDGNTAFYAKPITIDVTDALPVLSAGMTHNNGGTQTSMAGVHIGLGTMEIVLDRMNMVIGISDATPLDGTNSLTATNAGATFGTLKLGKATLTILDGSLEIAPH
jgi:hypothetical protein